MLGLAAHVARVLHDRRVELEFSAPGARERMQAYDESIERQILLDRKAFEALVVEATGKERFYRRAVLRGDGGWLLLGGPPLPYAKASAQQRLLEACWKPAPVALVRVDFDTQEPLRADWRDVLEEQCPMSSSRTAQILATESSEVPDLRTRDDALAGMP